MNQQKIGQFIATLRKEQKLTQKDLADRLGLSEKTISKWECGNGLPEVVFMEPLCEVLGITVNELLAGDYISLGDLLKKLDRSRLELVEQLEFEQLKMRIYKAYGLEIEKMEISENGAASLTYFVTVKEQKYVVKYASDNEMNHPELEPQVCGCLQKAGLNVCDFLKNLQGEVITTDEYGRRFHIQRFIDGRSYDYYQSNRSMQLESARMLAKIHLALRDYPELPTGIGADFFRYRTPAGTLNGYEETLRLAKESKVQEDIDAVLSNIELLSHYPELVSDQTPARFADLIEDKKITIGNTHGDYQISQILWNENSIAGVVDWTTACRHPLIWEILRSYVFMAPECEHGTIDANALIAYLREYLTVGSLKEDDITQMIPMFTYFLAVCDFYGQYYHSLTRNRTIYLKQARMASGLLRYLTEHGEELTKKLVETFYFSKN